MTTPPFGIQIKPKKRECVKSGRSGAHKPGKQAWLELQNCSEAGTGDLGVLPTHGASPSFGDAGSTHLE